MRYLTIIRDIDDSPRAWGSASTEDDSKAEAERQWTRRLEERKDCLDRSEVRGKTTTEELRDGATGTTLVAKTITIEVEVDVSVIESSVSSALAGVSYGIGYWASVKAADDGCPLVRERESKNDKPGKWLRLDDDAIKLGLTLMAKHAPEQFGQVISQGRSDACVGDLLIQYALLGEERYA